MPTPDIDFAKIRPLDGSRNSGFEELCSQLASLEDRPPNSEFIRKGRGGDAGLECFVTLPNGEEHGWQAKYVFQWDTSLGTQLDNSIRTALSKHPRLTRFVVCLPFDLSDSRPKNGKSARQKWQAWKTKWEKHAQAKGRSLVIGLWGRSELTGILSTDRSEYSGRLFYWFDEETLTTAWFREHFEKTKEALGSRYTPETNVELPIRRDFLAFARDPSLDESLEGWALDVADRGLDTLRAVARLKSETASELGALTESIEALNRAFATRIVGPESLYPIAKWTDALRASAEVVRSTLNWVYTLPEGEAKHGTTDQGWARHNLFRFGDLLDEIRETLNSDGWRLTNAHAVLLKGAAGTGKSHLLADVVEHQVHLGRPAILVLGSAMIEGDPWAQIISQLDLPSNLRAKQFLGSLDAAAQSAGVRAIVCVDAINERHGPDIWPERMAAFLKTAEPFPRVAIALSCRSTYVEHIVPSSISEERLASIEHHGFASRGGEAANLYLAKRGIVRPGAPNLVPEFLNPLFLKTCCDFLDREGKTELPKGLRGVSAIFGFYNEAVSRIVTRRMKLDPYLDLVPTALAQFIDILIDRGEGYAPKADAIAVFEKVVPSGGSLDRSLLAQFESEGILAIELVRQNDGSLSEMVRFTFERYSDHAIAARLLTENLDEKRIKQSFAPGERLGEYVFGPQNYRVAGIIEAMAIQLPEQAGMEIVDLRSEDDWTVRQAFLESLLWREQSFFTDRTFELANQFYDSDGMSELLISVATEPDNKFNADFLHRKLAPLSMPERDRYWSVYLNRCTDRNEAVGVLIDWAFSNGIGSVEPHRARLAALTLSWFLSSSNREIRDRATKALACLFTERLKLAADIIQTFADIDDLYVRERLLAAAYGAALQARVVEGLSDLALATYDVVFANGTPALNELLRDHARGIMTYARFREQVPSTMDFSKTLPPYKSPWPIEYVSDELIETYNQDYNGEYFSDAIVSSSVKDGDFARYIIDHTVDRWAPVSLSTTTCPSSSELAFNWIERFLEIATPGQLAAFEHVVESAKASTEPFRYPKTPEQEALEAAEIAFKATLSSDEWEEYRVTAKSYVGHWGSSDAHRTYPARFNIGWARRWVCKRAHELGWTPERFAAFEKGSSYERHDHRVERIGKKYQWLALGEIVARMADNLLFMGVGYGEEGPRPYTGARDVGLRDIDPSLLVTRTHYDGWKQWPRSWWVPAEPRLRQVMPIERLAWLDTDADLLNDGSLIDVTDPKTNRRWLNLDCFAAWRQSGIDGESRSMQRETWYRIRCIVVAKKDEEKVTQGLQGRTLTGSHDLPDCHLDSSYYLGEYPWDIRPSEDHDWVEPSRWNGLAAAVRPTTSEYLCERAGYDYSIDETIRIGLPVPWLVTAMGIRLRDGRQPSFVDSEETIRFFDPSVFEPGHQAALVDRDAFLAMLDRENLSAIWTIAGEKGVFGGPELHGGYGGRLVHTGVYKLTQSGIHQAIHIEREKPSVEQLKRLLGKTPSAAMAAQYASPIPTRS